MRGGKLEEDFWERVRRSRAMHSALAGGGGGGGVGGVWGGGGGGGGLFGFFC